MTDTNKPKRPRGRPVEKTMPPRIDASPDDIARAVMSQPFKKDWRYMKEREKQTRKDDED